MFGHQTTGASERCKTDVNGVEATSTRGLQIHDRLSEVRKDRDIDPSVDKHRIQYQLASTATRTKMEDFAREIFKLAASQEYREYRRRFTISTTGGLAQQVLRVLTSGLVQTVLASNDTTTGKEAAAEEEKDVREALMTLFTQLTHSNAYKAYVEHKQTAAFLRDESIKELDRESCYDVCNLKQPNMDLTLKPLLLNVASKGKDESCVVYDLQEAKKDLTLAHSNIASKGKDESCYDVYDLQEAKKDLTLAHSNIASKGKDEQVVLRKKPSTPSLCQDEEKPLLRENNTTPSTTAKCVALFMEVFTFLFPSQMLNYTSNVNCNILAEICEHI